MSLVTDSINNAVKLNQIGFPEFTTKLMTDVFNAVISSNISQTGAYLDMINQTNKTIDKYILDSKDDISGTEILNFLVKVLPNMSNSAGTIIYWNNPNNLTQQQAEILNSAIYIPETGMNKDLVNTTESVANQYEKILDAIAAKLAASKYYVLKELIKLGLSTLVVKSGEIETKLNFETLELPFYREQGIGYVTDSNVSNVDTRSVVSTWLNYSTSNKYARVGVSTISETPRNTNGISVKIAGAIKLNFGAEYKNLVVK